MTKLRPANGNPARCPDVLRDLTNDDLLQLGPQERLWKLYCFRSAAGQATGLLHRVYTKVKADGRLALVTFAVHTPVDGRSARSAIARVPDLTEDNLKQIVAAILHKTHAAPGDHEEIDLSGFATLDEQISHLEKLACF